MTERTPPWDERALVPVSGAHASRRSGRSIALQALYEVDIAHHEPQAVLAHLHEAQPAVEEAAAYARRLVDGVLANRAAIDDLIRQAAPAWPLEQMAAIDRNILRLAIQELLFDNEVPDKVAINEAVELAKLFGSDTTPRFVNGVLGTLAARSSRPDERAGRPPAGRDA
jgi:N utilization substance protein B